MLIPFEDANVEAYRLLLRIEVALRELLRDSLQRSYGARWRRQLPPDLRKQIHEAQTEEDRRRQFDFARLGPLYYLTFGELLNVLQQSAAKTAVARIGGATMLDQLQNLFSPRNALAHSRSVSKVGLQCVQALYAQLESALTPDGLGQLLADPDIGARPDDVMPALTNWLDGARSEMAALAPSASTHPAYEKSVVQYWWDMPDVAGFEPSLVDKAAKLIEEYSKLPHVVGAAAHRQRFVEQYATDRAIAVALDALNGAK